MNHRVKKETVSVRDVRRELRELPKVRRSLSLLKNMKSTNGNMSEILDKNIAELERKVNEYHRVFENLSDVDKAIAFAVFWEGESYRTVSAKMHFSERTLFRKTYEMLNNIAKFVK